MFDRTTFSVRIGLLIEGTEGNVDTFTDRLMAELAAVNPGADLGGSVASGEFDVWVTQQATTASEAVALAAATVRAAARVAAAERWGDGDAWPAWIDETTVEAQEAEQAAQRVAADG